MQMISNPLLWKDGEHAQPGNCCGCQQMQPCCMEGIINLDSCKWQCNDMGTFGSCFLLCVIYAARQKGIGILSSLLHML